MDIQETQTAVYATAVEHGWWDTMDDCNVPTKLALIAGEVVGEALEAYREGKMDLYFLGKNPETGKFGGKRLTPDEMREAIQEGQPSDFKPMGFGTELADAVIRIMDLAEWLDIPLDELIAIKAEFNKSRPPRHGGKKV